MGICFEEDQYAAVAEMGRQFGDESVLVRGTPGIHRCKTGDHLITLGETTGAPGLRIVIEVTGRYRRGGLVRAVAGSAPASCESPLPEA